MSFNVALSGLNAAQKDLDVTSNNIANVNTTGFKESRAEFVDVYAASLLQSNKTKTGDGALTSDVAQQFHQGSINFTSNALDLAITGNGFFTTVPALDSQEYSYTRAGEFKLNNDNFIVNSRGEYLMGYDVNPDGTSTSVSLSTANPIQIPTASGSPTATTQVEMKMNLPAGDPYITGAPGNFDPTDSATYNASTSVTVYDSLGDSHILTYYFIKDDPTTNPNQWIVATALDGQMLPQDPGTSGTTPSLGTVSGPLAPAGVNGARLTFDSSGDFIQQDPDPVAGGMLSTQFGTLLTNGADPTQTIFTDFNLDTVNAGVNEPTQYASNFEVTKLSQDGLPVGQLVGLDIGPDGLVMATYSNGTAEPLARIALANFTNEQGLTQAGNTSWKESLLSGEAIGGEAGSGTYGTINSSALEQSNVNLTNELIDLISAQRNFQANSRSLEVSNTLDQTILQIR